MANQVYALDLKLSSHPAVQCVRSFIHEMTAWEVDANRQYRTIDWGNTTAEEVSRGQTESKRKLVEIFETYCDAGAMAKRLQDEGCAFDIREPDDTSDHEYIISVVEKPTKVLVVTQQTVGCRWKYRYEVVLRNGEWWIRDNKKYSFADKDDWEPDLL